MKRTKIEREVIKLSKELPIVDIDKDQRLEGDLNDVFCNLEMEIQDEYWYNHSYGINNLRDVVDNWELVKIKDWYKGYNVIHYAECKCHQRSVNAFPRETMRDVAQEWSKDGETIVLKKAIGKDSKYNDYYIWWNNRTRLSVREDNLLPTEIKNVMLTQEYIKHNTTRAIQEIVRLSHKEDYARRIMIDSSINERIAEYLAKTRQLRMLNRYISWSSEVNEFFQSIKIAHRHHYYIRNISTWFNYLHLLKRWGKDLSNPSIICPSDLITKYKAMVKYDKRKDAELKAEQHRQHLLKISAELDRYAIEMAKYLGITFKSSDGKIEFKVMQTGQDFIEEGKLMHNCVGGYYRRRGSVIMIAIDTKTQKHLADIEISLENYKIIQCYAPCNKISKYDKLIRLTIENNINLLKVA